MLLPMRRRGGSSSSWKRMRRRALATEALGRLRRRAEFQRVARGQAKGLGSVHAAGGPPRRTATTADGPARRLHRHQEGRHRRRTQPHPPPAERSAALCAAPLRRSADHDYVLMARREALARPFAALRRGSAPGIPRRSAQRQRRPPAGGSKSAKRQRQATMNSEDTRNLFLAIALSVLVMAAWQYFYAGPIYQRQHPAQTQTNVAAPPSAEQPSQAGQPQPAGAAAPGAAGARRGRDRDGPEALACEPARRHRHAEPRRLDRPQGRQARRPRAQGLSRDDRAKQSPLIRLFSPTGAPDAYWATAGYISADGASRRPLSTRSGPPTKAR